MNAQKIPFMSGVTLLVGGLALIGHLFAPTAAAQTDSRSGQIMVAMSIFMGGEEPKSPPPKPVAAKPQTAPAQRVAQPTPPAGTAQPPAQGSPAKPVATSPAVGAPSPTAQGSPAAPSAGAGTPTLPAPASQTTGAPKELPKPAVSTGAPATSMTATANAPVLAETAEGYTYDPKSRRDPFQSLTRMIKADKTKPDMPPLQRVQISDLKLLGIMWGGYGYYGLVQTPDGKGYTVKEGMLIGTNNGVITTITDKAIIVSEPSIDITGQKSTKDVEILLRPKEVS